MVYIVNHDPALFEFIEVDRHTLSLSIISLQNLPVVKRHNLFTSCMHIRSVIRLDVTKLCKGYVTESNK